MEGNCIAQNGGTLAEPSGLDEVLELALSSLHMKMNKLI